MSFIEIIVRLQIHAVLIVWHLSIGALRVVAAVLGATPRPPVQRPASGSQVLGGRQSRQQARRARALLGQMLKQIRR